MFRRCVGVVAAACTHVRVLRTLVGRHLRKAMGELHGRASVYHNVQDKGSTTFKSSLDQGMILTADLGGDLLAKILVYQITNVAAIILLQPLLHGIPMAQLGVFPPNTTYVDLKAAKIDVPADQAHVRIVTN